MKLIVLFVVSAIIGSTFFILIRHYTSDNLVSPLIASVEVKKQTPTSTVNENNLKEVVEKALGKQEGTFGIVIKQLKTGERYDFNEHKLFESGSLYKLWVLATAFDQIEKGKLKEDEILSQDVGVLNSEFDIASESAELTEGTATYTVNNALEQMITISDNYAALLLSQRLRLLTIEAYLTSHQLLESALGEPPQTTAYDSALFFEKLYNGELANSENTKKMIDVLKRQKFNNKLPKLLPHGTELAHKTGEIDDFSHDAGILYTKKGDYVIAVLTESDTPADAEEKIAEISKAVFDYITL